MLAAKTGEEALALFDAAEPSLILLDIMLPGLDGLEVCRRIRRVSSVPILMITAKDEDADRILGLDIGADDYIVKPFSPGEVMARIRAVLRRIPAAAEKEMLVIGELSIHLPSLSVTLSGHKLNLTRREVELLYTLAASPGRVFTRDNLLTIVWGMSSRAITARWIRTSSACAPSWTHTRTTRSPSRPFGARAISLKGICHEAADASNARRAPDRAFRAAAHAVCGGAGAAFQRDDGAKNDRPLQ